GRGGGQKGWEGARYRAKERDRGCPTTRPRLEDPRPVARPVVPALPDVAPSKPRRSPRKVPTRRRCAVRLRDPLSTTTGSRIHARQPEWQQLLGCIELVRRSPIAGRLRLMRKLNVRLSSAQHPCRGRGRVWIPSCFIFR